MGQGRAHLRWDPVNDPTLAGYRAYAATASDGPFTIGQDAPLATIDPAAPTITLSDFKTDGTWWFTVTAYNTASLEGNAAGALSKNIVRPAARIANTVRE